MIPIDDIPSENQERILNLIKDLEMIVAERKDLENAEYELREQLFFEMGENQVDYAETEFSKIQYVPPKTTPKFDSKKLKQDHPEIYKQYSYDSEKKGFIKITIKKL
ncbi:hypothetical protein MmiEs2_10060 [Methanimicrococcus stummii]|uniref:Uncharacterized protein n=1 Tax=Methanimicrococcus stummii TaxID=3028294 RepID=A0AA96V9S0_9EURY|nr:hypothetical protein [Methanimicrococcus sp. Es2]WNY28798.1 hypothetical protein MmiEs2_10060 [Methanimicrococcus sp. Es2]